MMIIFMIMIMTIDAHCHRHCRRDPRIGRFWSGWSINGIMPFTKKLPKIWNHDISLPALQHIMTHEKSFVTFYMDTHFQNHCMIFTMHDSLQVASDSVSSPHRFFNSLILCAAFCFSSFLIWALIAFNSRESFFLPLLFTGAGKLGLVTGTSLLFGSSLWVMINPYWTGADATWSSAGFGTGFFRGTSRFSSE